MISRWMYRYSRVSLRPIANWRYQSTTRPNLQFNDQELQKIIESSNFGSEAKKVKEQTKVRESPPEPTSSADHEPVREKTSPERATAEAHGHAAAMSSKVPHAASSSFQQYLQSTIQGLPSNIERQRLHQSKRLEKFLESIQETILTATTTLNDVTGYSAIDRLKRTVEESEIELKDAKEQVRSAKADYSEAIQIRNESQKDINELLTRKHNWSSADLEKFTSLYTSDHANEQRVHTTQKLLNTAESRVDAIQLKLTQSILTRYHEEQIWSDKIRKVSTWGTFVLMGLNILLFVVATFLVEPWKRNRLVGSFEEKVKQVLIEQALIEDAVETSTGKTSGAATAVERASAVERESPQPETTATAAPITFAIGGTSWQAIKSSIIQNYNTLVSSDTLSVQLQKTELAIMASALALLGATVGSLVTIYFK